VYEGTEPYTEVSPDRCYILISLARYASYLTGDFAECGVFKGGTALLLARVLKNTDNKRLYLFDSFQGLPKPNEEKDPWFSEGEFTFGSIEAVEDLLSDFRTIIDIRCGWLPETFRGLENNRYAFVHLDLDLYQSNLDCCNYFYPRLLAGGVLLFDEYGFAAARGEKDAVDEFFADKSESPITLPTGQAIILKVPPKE
jgi:O-methyltransferase